MPGVAALPLACQYALGLDGRACRRQMGLAIWIADLYLATYANAALIASLDLHNDFVSRALARIVQDALPHLLPKQLP